ncbi:MAG TPA: NAD(P)H-binding protein [Edaphobacter sp.]|nr:NAD(P)H-binding protein [Edaphobacter sp.]HMF64967.1 NAD(P)H-binding protein [Edaphobacter sp.]
MRLTILGATGGIGRLLLPLALDQGHEVTAFVRAPEKITHTGSRLRILGGDLYDADQMTSAIRGSDAVLSAFGPTTFRRTHLRRDFGRTLVQALRNSRVTRFLHVSTAFLFRDGGLVVNLMAHSLFTNVTSDSRDCEEEMVQHDLAWTILRPPRLLDTPATGRARVVAGHLPKGGFTISRADVASFMLQETIAPQYVRQVVGLSN